MTLSPQMRIVALVGVLLIALGGSAFFVLHGHSKAVTPIATTPTQHPTTHPTTQPPRVHVVRPTVDRLLPTPLRIALKRNAFVVVGFFNPDYPVTRRTLAEARAGAAATHVAFVAVNLLNDAVAGRLTALLPSGQLLPNPGIAVYGRPGKLLYRADGYLDRAAVVEAVRGAR